MSVKMTPEPVDFDTLSTLQKRRILEVEKFVNSRGEHPTGPGDVIFDLGYTSHVAWSSLDLAWNQGLIAKAGNGQSCYWRKREPNGPSFYYLDENGYVEYTI